MLRVSKIKPKPLKTKKEIQSGVSETANAIKYFFEKEYSQNDVPSYKKDYKNYLGEGIWQGKLAEHMGLLGKTVKATDFDDLSKSINPITKEQFTKRTGASTNDLVQLLFSAPKDFSMLAFLDESIGFGTYSEIFDEAVDETMKLIESRVTARVNNKNETALCTNILYANFRHETSRPTTSKDDAKLLIRPDMQMHSHTLLSKYCLDGDGKVRVMKNIDIFKNQVFYGTYFRYNLAKKLIALGFEVVEHSEIETQKDDKGREKKVKIQSFKIKQITNEQRLMFSKRKEGIEYLAQRYGVDDTTSKDLIASNFRKGKVKFDRDELIQIWKKDAEHLGMDAEFFKNLRTNNRACIANRILSPEQIVRNSVVKWKGKDALFDTVLMQNICEYAQYVPIDPFAFKQMLLDEGYISKLSKFTYKVNFEIDKTSKKESEFYKVKAKNKQAFLGRYLFVNKSSLVLSELKKKNSEAVDVGLTQQIKVNSDKSEQDFKSKIVNPDLPKAEQVSTKAIVLSSTNNSLASLYEAVESLMFQSRKFNISTAEYAQIAERIKQLRIQIEALEKKRMNEHKINKD